MNPKLQYAEQRLKLIEQQHNAGTATEEEVLAAKHDRDLAAADVNGDKQAIARTNLEYAENLVKIIEAKHKAGLATEDEYQKAILAQRQAALELQTLEQYERTRPGYTPGPSMPPPSGYQEPRTSMPGYQAPTAQGDVLKSPRAAQMRTIVLAALECATEHPQWPKTLDELKPKYLDAGTIDLRAFVYYPLSAESLEKNPREVVVLAEREPAFSGGRLAGFADGYIEFIQDPERLKRLFPTETKSPSTAK